MKKFRYAFFTVLSLALMAIPAMAQGAAGGGDNQFTVAAYKALAAGLGFGIAAGLGGIGQGKVGAAAVEGAARNPGAAGTVQTFMIIGLALIESLVLFALVIVFVVLNPGTPQ
ncbi:MAG: ATP synthase F0 subunit C [Acidobacteriota bacterium]|nr:ATP synthase F0 subunit C [Acidobacteriota bacterium]MDH3530072.1 ATP synthase F0 subunit C [Acidobacteriota bacterium]